MLWTSLLVVCLILNPSVTLAVVFLPVIIPVLLIALIANLVLSIMRP